MKISLNSLNEATKLAAQRLHLTTERQKLATAAPIIRAIANVSFQGATMKEAVTVEISENKHGEISRMILACITENIDARIAVLDQKLKGFGIELEDAA